MKNFKLHEDTLIEAAPITVFIGPNNSGKSSVFHALLALRQAVHQGGVEFLRPAHRQPSSPEQPFLFPGREIVDIGEFKNVVRQGELEIQITASGVVEAHESPKKDFPASLRLQVLMRNNSLAFHAGTLECSGRTLSWERYTETQSTGRVSVTLEGCHFHFQPVDNFQLIVPVGCDFAPNTPAERQASIGQLSDYLANTPRLLLSSLHPIFPLRGFEEWAYWTVDEPAENLDRLCLPDRSVALASALASNRRLKNQISRRLEELLNVGIEIELARGKRVKIWATSLNQGGADKLFANEGTGANQLPFVLVPIGLASSNESILLSEPEAHLHPKAQSYLIGQLIGIAQKEHLQFFIETHSEHVLHKLLHAVARGDLSRDDLSLYYFENENGTAKVKRLQVNDKGQVDGGLPGFFDQSLSELTDYLDALRKP